MSTEEAIHEEAIAVGSDESALAQGVAPVARTQWQMFRRRFFRHRLAMFGLFMLVALLACCFGAKWIAPYKNVTDLLADPEGPSRKHWFGVDLLGRDYLTNCLYAGQISLKIGLVVSVISTVLGTLTGAVAGFFGGIADQVLMRVTDLFLLLPAIAVLAVALRQNGKSDTIIILVLAGLGWMGIARIVRGQVLAIKEKEFIEAARSIGCSNTRIILRHIIPNLVGPIMVNASLAVAGAIIAESTLSYLGFGVQPPKTSWGKLLSDGKESIATKGYLLYFPGLLIIAVTLAVNFLGDGLRDATDPQAKH
jgi:peptide/nickel transport system permease protein